MDSYLNRALEHARALQQIAVEAAQKGLEQSRPLIQEGVQRATELQKAIIEQTPHLSAAAQAQANAALQHASAFITTSKTVLEAGAAQAEQHMSIFAEQAKKAADATVSAVQSAGQKPPSGGSTTPPPQS